MADIDFVALPKIELHAHLSGSISRECLHEIWLLQKEEAEKGGTTLAIKDPLEEMPEGKFDYDLETFFPLFSKYIYTLITTPTALTHSTSSVLSSFAADGTIYLELRTTPRALPSTPNSPALTKADYISNILTTIANSPTRSQMTTKLILSIDRRSTLATAQEAVDLALSFRSQGVVGIDLCGDPSLGSVTTFTPAFVRAKAAGLKITIHFAEIARNDDGEEMRTMLSWMPDRLGHVIHVPEDIKSVLKERGIGLELCLSCNVHAKMMEKRHDGAEKMHADHHFGEWWASNNTIAKTVAEGTKAEGEGDGGVVQKPCPIILGTDDVGVFGSKLSDEYRLIVEHFNLNRKQILELIQSGIDSIFAEEDVKEEVRSRLWKV